MPLLTPPTLVGITGLKNINKHSVSFSYGWVGDAIKSQNFAGITFQGSSYTLDVSALHSNVADLPAFRSLLLTQDFDASANDTPDGELLVSVSGTGQILRFGAGSTPFVVTSGVNRCILTAQVPIIANAPTKITFAKGQDFGGVMFGTLTASIFDFDVDTYATYGSSN